MVFVSLTAGCPVPPDRLLRSREDGPETTAAERAAWGVDYQPPIAMSPDEQWLVLGSPAGVLNLTTATFTPITDHSISAPSVSWAPDSRSFIFRDPGEQPWQRAVPVASPPSTVPPSISARSGSSGAAPSDLIAFVYEFRVVAALSPGLGVAGSGPYSPGAETSHDEPLEVVSAPIVEAHLGEPGQPVTPPDTGALGVSGIVGAPAG